jgi:hypothetical protein
MDPNMKFFCGEKEEYFEGIGKVYIVYSHQSNSSQRYSICPKTFLFLFTKAILKEHLSNIQTTRNTKGEI